MEEESTIGNLLRTVRISGYLVVGGAVVGFSLGLYFLFNRALFSVLIRISQFEVVSYFLGVSIPSFAVLVVVGYLFTTTLEPKRINLLDLVPLCVLSLLCIVLSALSPFYFISFLGGLLNLTALVKAFTKPVFKNLSKGEAFFLVEIGSMLVASFSALSILMRIAANFFQTYAMGFYAGYSALALLWAGILSILMFFAISLMDSRVSSGLCGALGLIMSILSFLFVLQSQYVLMNATAYIGMFMLVLGYIFLLGGDLLYLRLLFLERRAPTTFLASSPLHQGRYCPYCGKPRGVPFQIFCDYCGRSLTWTPYAPFCSSCGLLVPDDAQACPHCQESILNKRIYFQLKDAKEHAVADRLIMDSTKRKPWMLRGLSRMAQVLRPARQAFLRADGFSNVLIKRLSLTPMEAAFIIIAACLFSFLFFWALRIILL